MVITIIAEPRSGSTNLANWFFIKKGFEVLFEPMNPTSKWYLDHTKLDMNEYQKKHLVIKEVYYPHKDYTDILNTSDKIIVLYRENGVSQIESFVNAFITDNWDRGYVYKKQDTDISKEKQSYFELLKKEFREKYIDTNEYFTISYEELYYKNGFQRIVDYIDLPEVENTGFPYGTKYRVDATVNKLI
jgi:hypothetical protein